MVHISYTEEQYKIYSKYILQIGSEIDLKGYAQDIKSYRDMEKWITENNITIDMQNEMDERFQEEYKD